MGSQTDVKETLHRAGKTALLTALLGLWAVAPSQVAAQVPEGTDPGIAELTIENGRISLSVNEATGVSLKDFIKLTEKITGKVITFSETDFQQPNLSINFYGTVNVSREQFFGFFQTMLYMRGFAVVIRGDEE